jgi:hypothetical protein
MSVRWLSDQTAPSLLEQSGHRGTLTLVLILLGLCVALGVML